MGIAIETGLKAKLKKKLGLAEDITLEKGKTVTVNKMSAKKWLARTTVTPGRKDHDEPAGPTLRASRYGKGKDVNASIERALRELSLEGHSKEPR